MATLRILNSAVLLTALACASWLLTGVPATGAAQRDQEKIAGTWKGEFSCNGGRQRSRMVLTIDRPQGSRLSAILEFDTFRGRRGRGRHELNGELVQGRLWQLKPGRWLSRPAGQTPKAFVAHFSEPKDILTARLQERGCTWVNLRRANDAGLAAKTEDSRSKPIPTLGQARDACASALDAETLARCLRVVMQFDVRKNKLLLWSEYMRKGFGAYWNPYQYDCGFQRKDVERDIKSINRRVGTNISLGFKTCEFYADLFKHAFGYDAHWNKCKSTRYSYENLRDCVAPLFINFANNDIEQSIRRYYEISMENPDAGDLPILSRKPLGQILERRRSAWDKISKYFSQSLDICRAGATPHPIYEIYASAIQAAGLSYSQPKARNDVRCTDVIRLGVELGLLAEGAVAAVEQEEQKRKAEKCDPLRATREPTDKELAISLNRNFVAHCTIVGIADKLDREKGAQANLLLLALTPPRPSGEWCVVGGLAPFSIRYSSFTKRGCRQSGDGRFECVGSAHLTCATDDPVTRAVLCGLFSLPDDTALTVRFDQATCELDALDVRRGKALTPIDRRHLTTGSTP